ncbi:FAD-dependent oxidoreductase [uncultured Desulfobacter sp.]|uniref:FAD-dependent oxidoreductase n=1 Tax=uncultured Desulfobacter sp. TaxID=240139 RepID=UPI002AA7FA25|nr:FAD-dependent oxidoreductase [uncultured Desulfobacter sp.]
MTRSFQAIVVGAGPAGSSAALAMARGGLDVALLERGNFPGEKNMFGGLLHRMTSLEAYIPEYWRKAPIERHVNKKNLTFMNADSMVNLQLESGNFDRAPYNGYTVLRPKFDNWLARQAVKAGATLITRAMVDDVIVEQGQVKGVTVLGRTGTLCAPVVIAADGVLSFIAAKAGLRAPAFKPDQMAVGVKALYDLPKQVIDDRFGLIRNQGVANEFVGCTAGVRGGGCLYTNYDSVSIGLVAHIGSLQKSKKTPCDLLNEFTAHPHMKKLLRGGRLMEYSAHAIPEGGYGMVPQLVGNGILVAGDAAAFCNVTGLHLEGVNLASHSGLLAAQTVIEAHKTQDFSTQGLQGYTTLLDNSFVMKDLKKFKRAPGMLHNDRIFNAYPDLACRLMEDAYRIDGTPKKGVAKLALDTVKKTIGVKNIARDIFSAWRAL